MDAVSPTTPAPDVQSAPCQDGSPQKTKPTPITELAASANAARRQLNMLVNPKDLKRDVYYGALPHCQSSVIQAAGGRFGYTDVHGEHIRCHIRDVPKYDRYGEIRKAPCQQCMRAKKAKVAGPSPDAPKHKYSARVQKQRSLRGAEAAQASASKQGN
ncbi:hypothetical protein FS749_012124 [Ceratobasidium sp. UAMH 11750]|nr:hypothetical protein FS749_012124 [Ceratobasidium sp. UAMH 11750]